MSDVVIEGMGWLDASGWGCGIRGTRTPQGEIPPWKHSELFPVPPKNMGRFSATSRFALCACALALKDAEIAAGSDACRDMGLLGTNESGCLAENRAYFADYLTGGRALARSNLFVYTLPSSPLAEASIHFGLQGPMVYIGCPGGELIGLVRVAVGMVAGGEASRILAVRADDRSAEACVVGPGPAGMSVEAGLLTLSRRCGGV